MSEAGAADPAPRWVPSALLGGGRQTPRFLRAPWDASQAHPFGPWRVSARSDPALGYDGPPPGMQTAGQGEPELIEVEAVVVESEALALSPGPAPAPGISPEELREAQAQSYAQGLAEGLAQARAELQAERAQEGELLRHLTIELRALGEDPDRYFEPLRRLALHIAEQLVRGELQASGHAVTQIVRQALAALDAPASKVIVHLHPDDAALLGSPAPGFLEGLKLQPDPQLTRGSVRLRMDDSLLEDLIENRLQALVQRLLVQPGGRAGESVLLREVGPTGDPPPRRVRPGGDIIDATVLPARSEPPAASDPPESQEPG